MHFLENLLAKLLVGCVFTRVTCRINTRRAVEKIYLKPAVIGNYRFTQSLKHGPRFYVRVFLEGVAVLDNFVRKARVPHRNNLEAKRLEKFPEFAQLSLVVGRDYKPTSRVFV